MEIIPFIVLMKSVSYKKTGTKKIRKRASILINPYFCGFLEVK